MKQALKLTSRDITAIVEALVNPSVPNERLKVAAQKYNARYGQPKLNPKKP